MGFRRRLFERSGLRGSLAARVRREDGGRIEAGVDLRVGFGRGAHRTSIVAGAATARAADRSDGTPYGGTGVGDADASYGVAGVEHRWRAEPDDGPWRLDGGAWASSGRNSPLAGFDVGVNHDRFEADVQSQWRDRPAAGADADTALRFATRVVLDDEGLAFAGPDTVHSGVIVDVTGEPAGAGYDIVADGVRVASGRIGTPEFVALPPFERYRIRLLARSLLASSLDQENLEVTLYPGAVARLSITARERRLVIASVVGGDGEPLGGATVERENGPLVLGEDSLLQVEAGGGEIMELRRTDGSACRVRVPTELGKDDVVVLIEPLVCR